MININNLVLFGNDIHCKQHCLLRPFVRSPENTHCLVRAFSIVLFFLSLCLSLSSFMLIVYTYFDIPLRGGKKLWKQRALISCHLLALPSTIPLLKDHRQRRLEESLGDHSLRWQKRQKYIIIINLICDCGWQVFPICDWWVFTMPTCTHQCVTMHAGAWEYLSFVNIH